MNKVDGAKNTLDTAPDRKTEPGFTGTLDAEVAEKIMRWFGFTHNGRIGYPPDADPHHVLPSVVPDYSTDIAAAMEVVEKFKLWTISKSDHPSAKDAPYTVTIFVLPRPHLSVHKTFKAEAATLPEAICRAALSLVDSTTEERGGVK